MKKYEVLWIDDDAEKQDAFLESAYLEGLNINYFKTSKQGMEELTSKIELYDAVILDALVYNESEDEKAGLIGLLNSIKIIHSLANRKKIPYFIFSGYIDQDEHTSAREMLADETIFIKSKDNHALFGAIKKAADKHETTQLKHKYPKVFALCEDNYIGSKHFERILQLVKDIENPDLIYNQQDTLLPIRKVLEALFEKMNKIGLVPDEIQNGSGAINGASSFLGGYNKYYNYKEELIHPVIAATIRHLISFTQDAAHNEGNKLGVDTYLSSTNNNFLYQSLCYSLLEVLDYLKSFIDANSDKEKNQRKWSVKDVKTTPGELISGSITKIAENGWGTFESNQLSETIGVHINLMKAHSLVEGSQVNITTKPSPCGNKLYIREIVAKIK
ncbi:hypothetical protein [Arenibacter latericius]|uniref:hypothetical protein n=1 Tax=Arenibacter latericius TaxID=86104 RepID=UPI000405CA08|nr:hypothetical protein [Arenibacter latericius]